MSQLPPEIDSRFDVLAKLGEGGMGTVYKVRHRDLDEIQIVKTLQAHLSASDTQRTRFVTEARRGMKLRHPHIAGVHDFQLCADGTGFIVMEYVHGLNLHDVLSARGPLPLPLVGAIAVQALDALGYLHGEHFVHRDISPDNLMLATTNDGRPFIKLIDLGIAKSLDAGQTMTATGQFLGKVHYASPEQFGGELDGRSDLYSLGVVLYRLLTNKDPFPGENPREVIAAHLFQPPRRFEEVAPDIQVPEAVQRVIYRAMEKEPDKRFASAAEFRDAVIEAFDVDEVRPVTLPTRPARTVVDFPGKTTVIDQAPPTAGPTVMSAPPTVLERPAPRRRVLPILAVIVVLALLALGAYAYWRQREAAALARYGKFYAVVIGESQYRRYPALPTAVDDARAVAQLLHDQYGFEVTKLENATMREIDSTLRATGKRLGPDDNLLIYYAGHGEVRGDKGYWQPVDAELEMVNWIEPATVRDILLDYPTRRTLLIADTCYAGAIVRGALSTPSSQERTDKRSRLVISSGGIEPIVDSADGRHSIFTRAFLDTLGTPKQKVTDVQSIFPSIRAQVVDSARRAGTEQKPQLAVIAEVGDEGGSFFFLPKR